MAKKRALCCISVDIDAVAGWLGSYQGEDSTSDISRGLFAGTVGVRRLLKLFDKYKIKTTWFIPGHSLDTFREECEMVRDAGHEIGLHGYSHENPTRMNLEQQHAILDKTYNQLKDFCGKPPRGVVAPWWESSKEGAELMMKYGVEYDHNFTHHDCLPYYLRIGDSWTPIDYDKHPSHWMKPLEPGRPTGLVEIPANWYLDDLPPMMFIKKAPNSHGWVNPRDVEDLWRDHFDYFYREYDDFCFPVTIHPDVSGHPHVIFMLERLIEYISSKEGVEWVKMEDICDDFKKKNQPVKGALLPAEHGAIAKDPSLIPTVFFLSSHIKASNWDGRSRSPCEEEAPNCDYDGSEGAWDDGPTIRPRTLGASENPYGDNHTDGGELAVDSTKALWAKR
ncbi:MAG: hypothetical protein Q9221_002820 [Calogaya cf. arnoldii]